MLWMSFMFTACPFLNEDDFLPSDEARLELRAASKELDERMLEFMQAHPVKSAMFLMDLISESEPDVSQALDHTELEGYTPETLYNLLLETMGLIKKGNRTLKKGIFRFNFNTRSFDQINLQVNYLEYIFPANESILSDQLLNAALTLRDLEYIEVARDESAGLGTKTTLFLTRVNASMYIDNQTVMTFSYQAEFNPDGLPTAINYLLKSGGYEIKLVLQGSGQNISVDMSYKSEGKTLVTYALKTRYTPGNRDIQLVSGQYTAFPIRFDGEMLPEASMLCSDADLSCFNRTINITVRHNRLKKKIGTLAYRMHYDTGRNEEVPVLHIIYEDGSADVFYALFDMGLYELNRVFAR